MRFLKYILVILIPFYAVADEWNMITIRDLYAKASTSKTDSEKLKTTLEAIKTPNECIKGYIAVSNMIEANYVYSPYTKLSYFNKGKALLDQAIKNDNQNIELRYLRLCVQTNAPSFLGYNKQIETDKAFIILKYSALTDLDLKKRIREYMIQSSICTELEKKNFN